MSAEPSDDTQQISLFSSQLWPVWVILVACVSVEAVLSLSDLGLIEWRRARAVAFANGGFWPGLTRGWTPNYTAQPYLMYLSYGFLHGGFLHLLVNMVTLISFGPMLVGRVGSLGFIWLYGASILGGAIGYQLLAPGISAMVGASGALFGLIGGYLAWQYLDKAAAHESRWGIFRAVLLLIALNLVLWWSMDGKMAWETHLGGFLTGWLMAFLIDPISPAASENDDEDA